MTPDWLRRLLRRRSALLAGGVLAAVVSLVLAAPLLPLPDPARLEPHRSLVAPGAVWEEAPAGELDRLAERHPAAVATRRALFGERCLTGLLGRDALGRDVLARLVWGGRVSLAVGLVATLVSVLIGVSWGLVAGFAGGRTDEILMRIVDALFSVPLLFVAILAVALLRGSGAALAELGLTRESILYLVIGAVSWLTMARVVRGQVLSLKERDFVLAARSLGAGPARLLLRHVLPNLQGVVIVYLTLTVPRVILFEAFLSFLGLGVEPPGTSWGQIAADGIEQLTPVSVAWWLVAGPGLALGLTLSALNTLGDALRDALDPRAAT